MWGEILYNTGEDQEYALCKLLVPLVPPLRHTATNPLSFILRVRSGGEPTSNHRLFWGSIMSALVSQFISHAAQTFTARSGANLVASIPLDTKHPFWSPLAGALASVSIPLLTIAALLSFRRSRQRPSILRLSFLSCRSSIRMLGTELRVSCSRCCEMSKARKGEAARQM